MLDEISYTFKRSILYQIEHWILFKDYLVIKKIGFDDICISYSSITNIRIACKTKRLKCYNYYCKISTENHISYTLFSKSYSHNKDVIAQPKAYTLFTQTLINRIKSKNKKTIISIGQSVLIYSLTILVFSLSLIGLVYSISTENPTLSLIFIAKSLLLSYLFLISACSLRVNKPKVLKDEQLPKSIFPQT